MTAQSLLSWLLLLALGLGAVLYAAAGTRPGLLLLAAGGVSFAIAAAGMTKRQTLVGSDVTVSRIESASAWYMGLVWAWGAVALFAVYVFILRWSEWWHFCLAFALAAALSFAFSAMLARDADKGADDKAMLTLGRYLAAAQAAGMIAAVVGLAVDPDKEFVFIKEGDWAGNSIFVCGALALAALSAHALLFRRKPTPGQNNA